MPGAEWFRWRVGRLRKAGFPAELAERLAHEERVDLHELLELVDRGCPPHLAERILTPLEDAPHPTAGRQEPTSSPDEPTAGREEPTRGREEPTEGGES
jgi:hypothetical protein